jgi:hypothetical protein
MRLFCYALGALLLMSTPVAIAKDKVAPAKKSGQPATTAKATKSKKLPAAAPAPPPAIEKDPGESAVASCKKHVESMLKESAETQFASGPELRVQPKDGDNFDVSGWVSSKANSGQTRRADFNCHASRFGGGLWTTRTSLSFDQ